MRTALLAALLFATGCGKNAEPAPVGAQAEITGTVRIISMDAEDMFAGLPGAPAAKDPLRRRPILVLDRKRTGAPAEDVTCVFDANAGEWYAKLQIGDTVTLRGTVTGRTTAGDGTELVTVRQCEFVRSRR